MSATMKNNLNMFCIFNSDPLKAIHSFTFVGKEVHTAFANRHFQLTLKSDLLLYSITVITKMKNFYLDNIVVSHFNEIS